jgi:xanthine/CO dehydrogenase XdhC/CoxF family maturation factor
MSRILERAEREEKELGQKKAAHAAELKRLADEHDARMKKEAAEQKRKDDAEQAKRDAQFEAELEAESRALFFNGSPGAPESLYAAKREEFRGLVLRRRAEAAADLQQHSLYLWR